MELLCPLFIVQILFLSALSTNGAFGQELQGGTESVYTIQGSSYFFYQHPEYPRDCDDVRTQCSEENANGVFLIKPDGLDEFEAYCNSEDDGGWTVIHRRVDGSVDFDRGWSDYKNGFGFLGSDFWIGNERLSFLTNQKIYQLQIDFEISENLTFYVTFDNFRIGDEWGYYKLLSLGNYSVSKASSIDWCPSNKVFGNCSCQISCADPGVCSNDDCSEEESCFCPEGFMLNGDECVPPKQCGCFVAWYGVIKEGDTHVNDSCTEKCTCENGRLSCNTSYQCDANARCEERNNTRRCHCLPGFEGDGQSCPIHPTDCDDVHTSGFTSDGVYTIVPSGWNGSAFEVYCRMSDDGGWTVFQRRLDGLLDFYRDWNSYKQGFGSASGEFWLGNEKLHYMTSQSNYKMAIDLVNRDGVTYNLTYDLLHIGNEESEYQLETLGTFTGYTESTGIDGNYIGCYEDRSQRALPNAHYNSHTAMTVQFCIAHCGELGYTYAGVQNSVECWCGGTSYSRYGRKPEAECRSRCNGNSNQYCGGYYRNSVYAVSNIYDYMAYHRGRAFSTYDNDNDANDENCASYNHGGWWYNDCSEANLNGDYNSTSYTGVTLYYRPSNTYQYSLRNTEMKIKRV